MVAESAWAKLPVPSGVPANGLPDLSELAFFEDREEFVSRRRDAVAAVVAALRGIRDGKQPKGKIISLRYTEGLPSVSLMEIQALLSALAPFVESVSSS
jgi:hypothetical protein